MTYTPQELMVAAAAREIGDREVVFVGMRLPLLAFALAKRTHAPRAVGLFENGIVRDEPARELLYTMSDPPNVRGATWCTGLFNVMSLLSQGAVHLGFIGGAQVDRFGNLNTSYIGDFQRPQTKLPGSGGGADIASLAQRYLIIMEHERRRLVEKVDYVTSPGYGDGGDWRARVGLPRGGPAALITTLGVIRFEAQTKEAYLASFHPHTSVAEILESTGWPLRVSANAGATPAPTDEELRVIRELDPEGFWTK
ncbi:MAG: CoA-transferase [Chloroflexi bacterium]|nr:MAG: CoA-transferase [Chloroflexota bacterium]